MDRKIETLLNSKWSILIALIPILNIAYLVLYFLFAGFYWSFYAWALPVALIIASITGRLLPENMFIVAIYVFLTVLAILHYIKRKSFHYKKDKQFYIRLIVIAVFLLSLCVMPFIINSNNHVKETTTAALTSIISRDSDQWNNCLHPNHDSELSDLELYSSHLKETGIALSGSITKIRASSMKGYTDETGRVTEYTYSVTVGGQLYTVYVTYLKNDNGVGIMRLNISQENQS